MEYCSRSEAKESHNLNIVQLDKHYVCGMARCKRDRHNLSLGDNLNLNRNCHQNKALEGALT